MKSGQPAVVYVMEDAGQRKVGFSTNPKRRSFDVGNMKRHVPISYMTPFSVNARKVECMTHHLLKASGKHIEGEWFSASTEECVQAIERAERIVSGLELGPGEPILIGVRLFELKGLVEDWRREQPTIPAKGVAIRELVQAGIDAYKGKLPKKVRPQ